MDFSVLESCMDLRDAHITEAVRSSESMDALLTRFAIIAAPGRGGPIILAALARLGTTACPWLDGELRVEISSAATKSKISASTTLGGGFREKLFPDKVLDVPLEEFSRAIQRTPRLIKPLDVKDSGTRIVLSITQEVRRTSLPPPMIQIDPESLMQIPKLVMPLGLDEPDATPAPAGVATPPAPGTAGAHPKVVLRRRPKP